MTNNGSTFYRTLSFMWDKEQAITKEWMRKFVVSKCPTLRGKEFMVRFNQ